MHSVSGGGSIEFFGPLTGTLTGNLTVEEEEQDYKM